jgi:hypothetical protein
MPHEVKSYYASLIAASAQWRQKAEDWPPNGIDCRE